MNTQEKLRRIDFRLKTDVEVLSNTAKYDGYTPVYIALRGSQNYEMASRLKNQSLKIIRERSCFH